ncbi:MAG: translocation/assembly module TamB [Elusimicrobia bacterium]|nr:translocation/assembly module TamB [Elusimicrobiota bacterium]
MRRWIGLTFLVFLVLGAAGLFSGILFFPLIRALERGVGKNTPLTLTLGGVRLSLTGDIILKRLVLKKGGTSLVSIPKIRIDPNWSAWMRGNLRMDSLTLVMGEGVLKATGTVTWTPPSVTLGGTTEHFPLERFTGGFPALPPSIHVAHTGTWRLEGDRKGWELNVDGNLDRGLSVAKSNPTISGRVHFEGPKGEVALALVHEKSEVSANVQLDTEKEWVEGDFKVRASPFSSFDALWADLERTQGSFTATGHLAGPWKAPAGSIRVRADGLRYKGFGIQSLEAHLERKTGGPRPLSLRVSGSSLTWVTEAGLTQELPHAGISWEGTPTQGTLQWELKWRDGTSAKGRGEALRKDPVFTWTWDQLGLIFPRGDEMSALPGGTVAMNPSAGTIDVHRLQWGKEGHWLRVPRFSYGNGNLVLEGTAEDFLLDLPSSLTGRDPLGGHVQGSVSLKGPVRHPQGPFEVRISSGFYGTVSPLSGLIKGTVENDRVIISEAAAGSGALPSIRLHGILPWAWILSEESDQPMDLYLETGRLDPALLLKGNPDLKLGAGGFLQAEGRVFGKKGAISLQGNLSAFLPSFGMPLVGVEARDTHIDIELKDRHLLVRKAETKLGKGMLKVSGESELPALQLEAVGTKISIKARRELEMTANLNWQLSGTVTSPVLSGTLALLEGTYEAGKKKKGEGKTVEVNPALRAAWDSAQIQLNATWRNNVWYREGLTKIETKADLEVIKSRGAPMPGLRGVVTVLKGNYDALGRDFVLQSGELTFTDPSELDPQLNLQATHKMPDALIELNVTGTARKPELRFQSTPPLPEQDILALLALGKIPGQSASEGSPSDKKSSEAADLAANVVSDYLTRELRSAGMNVLDLDVIRVSPSAKGSEWTVGRYWGSKLFLSYSYNPEDAANQVLKAEYSVSPRWTFVGQTGSQSDNYLDLTFRLPVGKSRKNNK